MDTFSGVFPNPFKDVAVVLTFVKNPTCDGIYLLDIQIRAEVLSLPFQFLDTVSEAVGCHQ